MSQVTRSTVLRLFGPGEARVTGVLKAAAAGGCPGLNLLMRDGEYAVCVNARAETGAAAQVLCNTWEEHFKKEFGPAVFGTGETGLAEAALEALAGADKLFVAADEATGTLLEEKLAGQELAGTVYDFGSQSYAHPKKAGRVRPDAKLEKKYPGDPVQQAAGQARAALETAGADWAVLWRPAEGCDPAFVLVCSKKNVWFKALPACGQPGPLAAGWLLDMLRRMALNLSMEEGMERFAYGRPAPELAAPILEPMGPVQPAAAPRPAPGPAPQAEKNAPLAPDEALNGKAQLLFSDEAPLPQETPGKTKQRTRWGRVFGFAVLAAAVAAGVWLWLWLGGRPAESDLGNVGYGTADYDTAARDYLLQAQAKNSGVAGYLALPKLPGALVYGAAAPAATAPQSGGTVSAAEDAAVRLSGAVRPGQPQANLLLTCPAAAMKALSGLDQQDTLAANSGFTLYTADGAYRYKIAGVFYWDPAETGEAAFDVYGLQDLANYQDYLNFVLGMKARSIYAMPANVQDGDSFATLVADTAAADGRKLVITGRMVRENEAAILFGKQIEPADAPLMPLAVYQGKGESLPSLEILDQYWMNWYVTGGATSNEVQEEAGMPDEDRPLDELPAGGGGGEEGEPTADPSATPNPSETPGPSPTPKPSPTPTGSGAPAATATPEPTAEPTPEPTQAPSSGTITVTMNGVRQEMDLVECLAMVARNELGPNAPYEAYKAQIVATHSWILNQGGAPSVSGLEPSENIRNAAREVANQLLTYGGSVAFTPYFASAAFGTNSSQEVWGGARPYLVNVDSPYDKDYASNWQNTRTYYKAEVVARAQDRLGVDLNAYSDNPEDWFGDIQKNSSGYVTSMRLGTATISGRDLREKVLNNVNGKTLRSAAFDISYDSGAEAFNITTYGYGHGCGLSQYGAWGYAANGWGYADILAHYFPGTTLESR